MFSYALNMGLPQRTWVEKTVHGIETHWLSGQENVPGTAVSKEGHADTQLGNKMNDQSWFPWPKSVTLNSATYCQLLKQYFTLFIE